MISGEDKVIIAMVKARVDPMITELIGLASAVHEKAVVRPAVDGRLNAGLVVGMITSARVVLEAMLSRLRRFAEAEREDG